MSCYVEAISNIGLPALADATTESTEKTSGTLDGEATGTGAVLFGAADNGAACLLMTCGRNNSDSLMLTVEYPGSEANASNDVIVVTSIECPPG